MARGGHSIDAVHGLLLAVASLVVEHRLQGTWASVVTACGASLGAVLGLSYPIACGILFLRPGVKPVSPALEGGFLRTGPPGKSP